MAKAFVIAAPWSNSGKTTFTLALCRLLRRKGLNVQPFKCGPDYIDTLHHGRAAGKPGINLDSFMMSEKHVQELFNTYASAADVAVVEGVMGLFDGAVKSEGSTAEIAKLLKLPVILVMNASSMAYSVAPLIHGLNTFDPEVKIAGVVFNFVRTESHYAFLKEACEDVGVKALGYLPPNEDIKIPSRHLGLYIEDLFDDLIEKAADHLENHIAVDSLLACGREVIAQKEEEKSAAPRKYRIAVARDEVFTFTYYQNLRVFEELGEMVYFSPLHDSLLPEADLLYLAGGYPELHLKQLSANTAMQQAIANFAANGGRIIAECGGMMYLGQSIIDEEGHTFPMAGIFSFSTSMQNKKLSLGYRRVELEGLSLKGHEFRYSSLVDLHLTGFENLSGVGSVAKVFSARNHEVETKIYRHKNVLASYIHFYWAEEEQLTQIIDYLDA
jgi:cobyrinic acid a,c-diamide synthase